MHQLKPILVRMASLHSCSFPRSRASRWFITHNPSRPGSPCTPRPVCSGGCGALSCGTSAVPWRCTCSSRRSRFPVQRAHLVRPSHASAPGGGAGSATGCRCEASSAVETTQRSRGPRHCETGSIPEDGDECARVAATGTESYSPRAPRLISGAAGARQPPRHVAQGRRWAGRRVLTSEGI